MQQYNLNQLMPQWQQLSPLLSVPHTEEEYDHLVVFLDQLVDEVGNDEGHPLASLMETVGTLIEAYDHQHYPFSGGSPLEALKYLMKEQGLTQSDLPEIGSQGVVSEVLAGKRQLNTRQIQALSQRFQVSPATFL